MARAFEFSDETRNMAFFRQWNSCAHCGRDLTDVEDHAHHVVPNQVGRAGSAEDGWIRDVDNCVVLCTACHIRVHEDGRYRTGAVASPADFPYSHGKERGLHLAWADRMRERFWKG